MIFKPKMRERPLRSRSYWVGLCTEWTPFMVLKLYYGGHLVLWNAFQAREHNVTKAPLLVPNEFKRETDSEVGTLMNNF